jgi:hypothetical protein
MDNPPRSPTSATGMGSSTGLGVLSVTDAGIARIFAFGGGTDLIARFGFAAVHHGTSGLGGLPTTNC